ncbi:hypothetical protein Poli38472_005722 [Pythium oligandrum]|uniref:Uncharacterized protein n=1 Tax=Pythium oligandrum TaxID=41045 RepID=A0A8K1CS57_PYTOL|nr:hypothetical protein Poli38472_005722 [Pythium oligandrum]|eukprot:TMW68254.1 hypothetical protein Poli38472_005722 [Pythium oligandrum]
MSPHFLGSMKASATSTASPPVGPTNSLNAVAASLRIRRKRNTDAAEETTTTNTTTRPPHHKGPISSPRQHMRERLWQKVGGGFGASNHDASDSDSINSPRRKLTHAMTHPPKTTMDDSSVDFPRARPIQRDLSVPTNDVLDAITLDSPPRVAVRYGDNIRLYARSKYVNSGETGGYVGTFEMPKRFLQSKNPQKKQGELACIPPIMSAGSQIYQPSMFTIHSTSRLPLGTPVSYGDVVVLVDDNGRVWNNKNGVGPTPLNGYFGPRDQNTPGEMYLSFYQLEEDGESSSSSESDDEDTFLSLSAIAKTTKTMAKNTMTMAETTFGKPTQLELDLTSAALRTMGRVVYYGDRNVIIDVADSNRLRSKFNRVVTHYRKNDELAVRGGYLRCDGKGKAILFEVHGIPLPRICSIDVSTPRQSENGEVSDEEGRDEPSLRVSMSLGAATIGHPIQLRDVLPESVVSLFFSDGGVLKVPCSRFMESNGEPFYRIVLGGSRPIRLHLRAERSYHRRSKVNLKKTLRGTYRELVKLFGVVVVICTVGAFLLNRVLHSSISLPATYIGGSTAMAVFLVEVFFPGKIIQAHVQARAEEEEDTVAFSDWKFTILSMEASESEREECAPAAMVRRDSSLMAKIPKTFIMAESGNLAKATERYEATVAWRKEMAVDTILSVPQTQYFTIKQYYRQFLHKRDKLGHPVYIQRIGAINTKALQKEGVTQDDLFRHYLFAMEFTLKYVANEICQCEACASSETQKLFIVLDARGIGMKDVSGDGADFIRKSTSIMQKHYPQRSYKIFFINVPSWFGMAWKGIKPLLNEATRAKTNILSESEAPHALLAHIDASCLPVEYGGTCECQGGCESGSDFQRTQAALVESVLNSTPFCPDDIKGAAAAPPSPTGPAELEGEVMKSRGSSTSSGYLTDGASTVYMEDDDSLRSLIPPGLFHEDVLRAGYLLKRPVKHKHFTPIWHRRFFILHPTGLRFSKTPSTEVYQIVPLTAGTVVRKNQKGNTAFELITPIMAKNGHSLVLVAPNPAVQAKWFEALQSAIAKLTPETRIPETLSDAQEEDKPKMVPTAVEAAAGQ